LERGNDLMVEEMNEEQYAKFFELMQKKAQEETKKKELEKKAYEEEKKKNSFWNKMFAPRPMSIKNMPPPPLPPEKRKSNAGRKPKERPDNEFEIKAPQEPSSKNSPIMKFFVKLFGYNVPTVLIRRVGSRIEYHHDLAKRVRLPHGTYKLKLYVENSTMPYPPPETWIDGTIWIYSPRRGEYTYLCLDLESGKIKAINSDMVFWVENEIMEAMTKYNNPNKWSNIIPFIAMGVFMLITVVALVVFMKLWYVPAMEVAKTGLICQTNCSCPIMTNIPLPPAPVG
jgi:hypothetical protein